MRCLLIDNYDSFTYNLFQLLAEVCGAEPIVVRNDDEAAWARLDPAPRAGERAFDAIVISPGPGRPDRERDFGLSRRALDLHDVPLLGVCLGHQGLCHVAGATIARAPEPYHGRTTLVRHTGHSLFRGIPSPFAAVRYHSLVAEDVPETLEVIARTDDNLVMAVAHCSRPHFGVQFHPESIAAEYGRDLLTNFRDLALESRRAPASRAAPRSASTSNGPAVYDLAVLRVENAPAPEHVEALLFDDTDILCWLDTSLVTSTAHHSMLCAATPALGELVSYRVRDQVVEIAPLSGGRTEARPGPLLDYLEAELGRRAVPGSAAPGGFALGYVGVLGYELKADLGSPNRHVSNLPDALLAFCDRGYVYDHRTGSGWLLALHPVGKSEAARDWLARARGRLLGREGAPHSEPTARVAVARAIPRHDATRYRALIAECQAKIAAGESYELCLTNRLAVPFEDDPLATYRRLRRQNPAPYAAFLRFPGVSILSSSPECFLRGDGAGQVESRPIKGTARRASEPEADAAVAAELAASEKERAENLMIVDLVRNDLGRVCEVGSVHVPSLFAVESYATVHQLVSTVRGRLAPGVTAVECVRACFPGGSMTGAPKLRTMEILDALEGGPRGLYSGALGYFSLNGAFDLSIVIRTLVVTPGEATLGVGGAIVSLSNPDAELDETALKAEALLRALGALVP